MKELAIIVFAAASLSDALQEISASYPEKIVYNFAGSSTLARQIESRSGINVDVSADIVGAPIPARLAATLFRVAQEALRNIEVHSHAKSATVNVHSREGSIRIEVSDDGCGFDPSAIPTMAGRSALSLVKDRVMLAGGVLRIDSAPNGGTRVTAELNTLRAAS